MGFGKDGKGAIIRESQVLSLATLADGAALKFASLAITDDFRILKTVLTAYVTGLTAGEGEGLNLGICNADISVADIQGCISTDGPLNSSDRDKQETAERFCRIFADAQVVLNGVSENFKGDHGGNLIEVKPRWTFNKGVGWTFFVFNNGVILTTGATVRVLATHYGVWV